MSHAYDISHFFAGLMLVVSFALIYQDRVLAVLRTFAVQAIILAMAVAWEAWAQSRPHLYITAALAFGLKGIIIPLALNRMIFRLGIQREVEQVVGVGLTMLLGLGLTALSLMLVLKATAAAPALAREGLAISLAIILLGILMMVTRRNAFTQIIGFMSIENGLILGATGARGMPLVVEISVAFSVLIALFVFAVFVFRIRERFDTVDVIALERVRGDRP
ncbi:MAG: hydrogenase-4 component E [Hyphomicrobiaceae bacterium]